MQLSEFFHYNFFLPSTPRLPTFLLKMLSAKKFLLFQILFVILQTQNGPVAQLNRVSDYGSEGFRFES